MRRRALLAASDKSGGGGGNGLPIIPDGFFPLYLTHDSYDDGLSRDEYVFNSSNTTRELWDIIYGYAIEYAEFDGDAYDFYPVEYGIEVYMDGYQITNFYVHPEGYAEIFFENIFIEGTFSQDKSLFLWII